MLIALTDQVARGQSLDDSQAAEAVAVLADAETAVESKAEFLAALARKGETPGEIAAFARELRKLSRPVPVPERLRADFILDVCGTGGDRLNTFNISTAVALLASAAGVVVAKHGNRAITSQSGSADVLDALGIPTQLEPDQAAAALAQHGFAFLFAPKFHPAFKNIGPARKLCADRRQRTIFNFLGPLLNPARPSAQLVGVSRADLCEPMAQVLQSLGVIRGMVVCGSVPVPVSEAVGGTAALDEISPMGPTRIAEFYQASGFSTAVLDPSEFPLSKIELAELKGGSKEENAQIIRHLFAGEEQGPRRQALLLNAGAALFVAGKAKSIAAGWDLAASTIDRGLAKAQLERLAGSTE